MIFKSLVDGFLGSNAMGQFIVYMQIAASIVMYTAIIAKAREISCRKRAQKRFLSAFGAAGGVLDYYIRERPDVVFGVEKIYKATCERLLRLLTPGARGFVASSGGGAAAERAKITAREQSLVEGACEHVLEAEEIDVSKGLGVVTAVVALAPMLGLLGTVWGVLDAFAEMGTAGSANLATIAPSISAALVTTVVGLLIAIPGVCFSTRLEGSMRELNSKMEGFADELTGRIACEYEGKDS